jgi:putative transposase
MIEPEKRRRTMRGTRFNQEQIIAVLREAEAGLSMTELSRKYGICQATIYHWKAKYGDMTISQSRRLKILEEENGRLKHIVAEQALEIKALKLVVSKNF